jgi:serine/threonine-protein kinase HipA
MLIAPGGSLGGARPKASVEDPDGHLWIAKFPSTKDKRDMGAWELLVQTLARVAGLRVPDTLVRKFGKSNHHTFLVRRFDRTPAGERLHFASAMTLTGHKDGDDASTGASYLEIAQVLINSGADTDADLKELWSRIVFNILVSNTDDHLRNHGFIYIPGSGWKLSEAYDMNAEPESNGLKLNISTYDNAMDLDLALSVAEYFRLRKKDADNIIESIVKQWPKVANDLGLSSREQAKMSPAFKIAEKK